MRSDLFEGLPAFLAVAERRSFTAAAAELGVTPTAVSQTIRQLEARLGLTLFQRTTRRVGLTEAGAAFLAKLKPAANDVAEAIEALSRFRDRPAGQLRLTVPRIAVPLVIEPVLPAFRRACPDVSVEIAVEDAVVDLAARGFDAGIRIGEFIQRDMIAVRLTPDICWTVAGAPAYFAERGRPTTPEELTRHECIRYRFPTSGAIYRWEFVRGGRDVSVDPPGGVVVNDGALAVALAGAGLGLVYTADLVVGAELAAGRLERVLEPFLPTTPGFFLYFPARAQTQPKLRAFINLAVAMLRRRS